MANLYGDNMFYNFDITDEGVYSHAGETSGPKVYNMATSDPIVTATWKRFTPALAGQTCFLKNIDKPQMDSAKKRRDKGTKRFSFGLIIIFC